MTPTLERPILSARLAHRFTVSPDTPGIDVGSPTPTRIASLSFSRLEGYLLTRVDLIRKITRCSPGQRPGRFAARPQIPGRQLRQAHLGALAPSGRLGVSCDPQRCFTATNAPSSVQTVGKL